MLDRTPRWTPHAPPLDFSPHLTAHHTRPLQPHAAPDHPRRTITRGSSPRSRPTRPRIAANPARGSAPSAYWNVTARECCTYLAPILISFSRSVVIAHVRTVRGNANSRKQF